MKLYRAGLVILIPCFIFSQIYFWVDENGVKHYSSTPPYENSNVHDFQEKETASPEQIEQERKAFEEAIEQQEKDRKAPLKVKMYSTSWCPACKKTKKYFDENNIPYVYYDIEASPKRMAEYKAYGGGGIPLLVIGNQKMNGFSSGWVRYHLGLDD